MGEKNIITRKDLYREVWSTSMSQLSRKYGISDTGLAKICKRHNIPRPPRGYWAKLLAHKQVRKVPLPEPDKDLTIEFQKHELAAVVEKIHVPTISIPSSKNLENAHSLIKQYLKDVAEAEIDEYGIRNHPQGALNIDVCPVHVERALLIFDGLLKGLNARGYSVSIIDGNTTVIIDGIPLALKLGEEVCPVPVPVMDVDLTGRYRFAYKMHEYHDAATGRLCLAIAEPCYEWCFGFQPYHWENKRHRLESKIGKFVKDLIGIAKLKENTLKKRNPATR